MDISGNRVNHVLYEGEANGANFKDYFSCFDACGGVFASRL
jgi:hypothetical protein